MKIEGRNAVLELLKTEKTVDKILMQKGAEKSAGRIFAMARQKNIRVQFAEERALDRESETGRHQGVIAYVSDYEYADLSELLEKREKPRFVVVCDGVEDVHNLGSILRVAECAGADGVIIPKNKSAQVTGAVVRISEGAANHIKVARVPGINYAVDELKKAGYWVYGLEADGECLYADTADTDLCIGFAMYYNYGVLFSGRVAGGARPADEITSREDFWYVEK